MNYDRLVGVCKGAEFTFNTEGSFALYLDFKLARGFTDSEHAVSFYLSDYASVNEITKLLNKNKTGMAQDSLNNEDLKKLIGLKANILDGGIGSKCYFNGFVHEVEIKN